MWQDYDDVGVFHGEGQSHTGQYSITSGANGYDQNLHELTCARIGTGIGWVTQEGNRWMYGSISPT